VKVIQQAIASLHAYLERKSGEVGVLQQRQEGLEGLDHHQLALLLHALRHSGFRYSVVSHQNNHGMSHQTARNDLQELAGRGLLIAGKDGRREVFRVPEDPAARLPG
jgi:Fic family protein